MAEAAQPLEALVLGVLTESDMTSIEQEFSKPLVKFANDSPANSVNKAQFVLMGKAWAVRNWVGAAGRCGTGWGGVALITMPALLTNCSEVSIRRGWA
mmetsp:Transcript_70758/g.197907  ORF Transcript_70758/g.197907 Transcript_70758/m.197907 type:complete len:98 (-) Transcript_70758:2004-2297(-)